ncbi:LysR family transcriptional regulator [Pseudoroseomonas rhizosphaerae]|uniref:LysR family transcriptional regulator n=1 Tax=Teichococcus rhizosphaerae TaxID=1335062 RepID=A0A2C7AH92_9PROT|nr:LysR family transcriptional regulator [Pseudoroseomonas rhizosphaerae]PHK96855.1 LysR family transcriptional regulator [Pseudoroseomonas rhizosphaerae]
MSYSLRQIRALTAAVETGSFGRAALRLHVSQPALTLQIRALEESLGVTLFDRSARGVRPTPAGQALAASFQRILDDLETVVAGAREQAQRRSGVVHLAVLPSVAANLLPGALARLRAAHPGIRVMVRDAVARRVAALVKAGEAELGIGHAAGPEPELEETPLFEDSLVAVLPPGHPFAALKEVGLPALAAAPLVLTDPESSLRTLAEHAFAAAGLAIRPAYEATYMSTAVALVRAGLGIGLLPATAVELRVAPLLETRPVPSPLLRRRIVLLRRRGASLSPAAEALAEVLEG